MIRIVRRISNIIGLMTSLGKITIRKADGKIRELGFRLALFSKVTSKITLALLLSMTNAFCTLSKFITLTYHLHFSLFHLLIGLMTFPYPLINFNDLRMLIFFINYKKYLFDFYDSSVLNLKMD